MHRPVLRFLAMGALALASSCSSTFHAKACLTDADCGAGNVCVEQGAQAVC